MSNLPSATKEFGNLNVKMVQFAQTSQWRKAANCYLEMYKLPNNPSYHHWCLKGFTSILVENQTSPIESDLAFLSTILKDKSCLTEERAEAGFALGFLYWSLFRQEESQKSYRKFLKL